MLSGSICHVELENLYLFYLFGTGNEDLEDLELIRQVLMPISQISVPLEDLKFWNQIRVTAYYQGWSDF